MHSIKLDLKNFKHSHSDDHTTTLIHDKGHSITLAHKSLSPQNQEQLKALAQLAKAEGKSTDKPEAKQDKQTMMKAGGKVKSKKDKATVHAHSTPEALARLKGLGDTEYGGTAVIDKEMDQKPNYGKVIMKDDERSKFAEGGQAEVPDALKPSDDSAPQAPSININVTPHGVQSNDQQPQAQPPQSNDLDPQKLETEQIYNQMVAPDAKSIQQPGHKPGDQYRAYGGAGPSLTFGGKGEAPENFNPEVWKNAEQALQVKHQQDAQQQQDQVAKINAENDVRMRAGLPPLPVPQATQQPIQPPDQPDQLPQAITVPADAQMQAKGAMANGLPDLQQTQDMMQAGYQNQMAGIQQHAQAEGQLGQQQAQLLDQQIQAQNDAKASYQQHYNELEQERQAHMEDIKNNLVDPEQYWHGDKNGNGAHSKVLAGIGMILAGFNPTSNPNAAINYLKYQMDKNIDAQTKNLGARQSLLNANLHQFGNLRDATDMTRLMQADIVHNELLAAAGKAASPMAKAAAMEAAGKLQMEFAPLQQQFAFRRAMMGLANNQNPQSQASAQQMIAYARMMNPEMAKEMESRFIPGVGMGQVPVPESARAQIVQIKNVNDLMNKSLDFSKRHSGTLSPTERAEATTIQQQLIGTIKQAQHDGVYKPSEAEFLLDQIGGNPASFFAKFSSVPKIKELQSIKQQEYHNLLSTYGLPTQQLQQSGAQQDPQKALQWAQANKGKDPRADKILKMLGK